MRVLVACEFSGIVRDAFLDLGHYAVSLDLLPTEVPNNHLQMDIRNLVNWEWDLMIAHPPCTYLCNSGVRWLHERPERWKQLDDAAEFFKWLLNRPIEHIAVENPIPHRYAVDRIGKKYDQIIHPWQFGHNETKATCLWLKNLPYLVPTNIVDGRSPRIHYESPGQDRWKNRSRFFKGIASAMATQWGGISNGIV